MILTNDFKEFIALLNENKVKYLIVSAIKHLSRKLIVRKTFPTFTTSCRNQIAVIYAKDFH